MCVCVCVCVCIPACKCCNFLCIASKSLRETDSNGTA